MHLIIAGLNHKTAPVDVREKCAFSRMRQMEIYKALRGNSAFEGAVLLITCNRTEVYTVVPDSAEGFKALENMLHAYSGLDRYGFAQYIYQYSGQQAVSHLFAVSAGLDSMVLGEQQILGQVKEAYQIAQDNQATDSLLNILFQSALHAGKKIRTTTGIGKYPVSTSSAAVSLCREIFNQLETKQVLVVGAGETGELAVKHLMSNGVQSVIVANRTFDHAREMAEVVGGRAVHFDCLPDELRKADIVISCTAAPHFVIREDNCGEIIRSRRSEELVMIDLAVPRDIDPAMAGIDNLFLYDVDDLQNVVDQNLKERLKAAHQARTIIEEEAQKFSDRVSSFPLGPVIYDLRRHAETIKEEELAKALNKLEALSPREKNVVATLAHTLVNKLLHTPIASMKEKSVNNQGQEYAEIVKDLFNLHKDNGNETDQARNKGK